MQRGFIAAFIALLLVGLLIVGCGSTSNPESHGSDETQEPSVSTPNEGGEDPDTPSEKLINFIIEEPAEGELVETGGEVVIKGKTRVQNFAISIEDGHNILGEATVELETAPEDLEDFEVKLEIEEHTSPHGTIVFSTDEKTRNYCGR